MKRKVITILLMCALSVNFTACGNSSSENNVSSKESEEEKEAPADNAEISEPETSNPEDSSQETDDSKEDEKTQSEESDNPQPEEETQPEEPPYEMNTSAALKDWTITVTDAQIVDSISSGYIVFSPNEEGNKFIQVYATAENKGKQADNFLPSFGMGDDVNTKILYSDGYEFSATNLMGYDNDLHDSNINPLSSQTGEIAFEIPSTVADSADELLIQFSSGNDKIKFKIR